VRGKDEFNHYREDKAAVKDLDPAAIARHEALQKLYKETAGTA